MEHLERMRALRKQVDIIIEQTQQLERLKALSAPTLSIEFETRSVTGVAQSNVLVVPVDELRALIQKRIDNAELEIRKLGMVAPRPGADSIAAKRERLQCDIDKVIAAERASSQNALSDVDNFDKVGPS